MSEPSRNSGALHWAIVLVVFSITGMAIVRVAPLILRDLLGMSGGFVDGPWSYRLVYLLLIPPCYSVILVIVGTIFGKHRYFRARALKMWSRLLPGPLGRKLAAAAAAAGAGARRA